MLLTQGYDYKLWLNVNKEIKRILMGRLPGGVRCAEGIFIVLIRKG